MAASALDAPAGPEPPAAGPSAGGPGGPPPSHKLTFAFETDARPIVSVTHGPGWTHVAVAFEPTPPGGAGHYGTRAIAPDSANANNVHLIAPRSIHAAGGQSSVVRALGPAEPAGGRRSMSVRRAAAGEADDERVAGLAQMVIDSIDTHGAAPDLVARTKAGRRKAINYIRSVVGEPTMTDADADRIRRAIEARPGPAANR